MSYQKLEGKKQIWSELSLLELQETLADSGEEEMCLSDELTPDDFTILAQRLRRVRSWGGYFSEIEFSDEVQSLLRQGESILSVGSAVS